MIFETKRPPERQDQRVDNPREGSLTQTTRWISNVLWERGILDKKTGTWHDHQDDKTTRRQDDRKHTEQCDRTKWSIIGWRAYKCLWYVFGCKNPGRHGVVTWPKPPLPPFLTLPTGGLHSQIMRNCGPDNPQQAITRIWETVMYVREGPKVRPLVTARHRLELQSMY